MAAIPQPLATVPAPDGPAGFWWDRWLSWRNRLLSSPRFQRWAADFPLTRPVARRNARALFDLVAGFVYSQILVACVRLDLFDILAAAPLAPATLARRIGLAEPAAVTLLKAASSLKLVQALPDGRYGLGPLGAALRGNPSLGAMIAHHAMLYADLTEPVSLLRGQTADPQLAAFWAYAGHKAPAATTPAQVRGYSALMAQSQELIAGEVLDAYSLRRHRRLLDIGGGEGVFLSAAGIRYPDLGLMLFDLPSVVERAPARFEGAGVASRATIFAGDFFRDRLPTGADIVSLVRVLHDHDDEFALAILRKAYAALPKDGILLVAEPMSGTSGAEPAGDAYFGIYLAAMGSGRPRTAAEISLLLRRAGFHRTRLAPTRTPMVVRVMVANS